MSNKKLFFDGPGSQFDDLNLINMDNQNIQTFVLKSGDSGNDQTNNNGPNIKLKYLYNVVKVSWILKYGMENS